MSRSTTWSERLALLALSLALAAGGARGAEAPASRQQHRAPRGRWTWRLATELRYDTNVLELSAKERKQVGDPAQSARYGLQTPDDVLLMPELGLSWSRNLLRQRATSVSAGFEPVLYLRNSYLNRHRWTLELDQELGRDRRPTMSRIGMRLATAPEVTLRRLRDDDVSLQLGRTVRVDAVYSTDTGRLEGTVELVRKRLALELGADTQWRDYIDTFDERDGHLSGWDARLVALLGARSRWRVRASWRSERYDGRGDDPSTILVEDDISSDRSLLGADLRFSWGRGAKAQRVWATFERELRDYTAPSPFDLYHHARHDERFAWGAGWRRSVSRDLDLSVALAGDGNRSTFRVPPPPQLTPSDSTDYDVTTVTVGLAWSLTSSRRASAR